MTSRILVVDDEPQIRRVLKDGLVAEGYAVATAGTGEEALRVLPGTAPDLIVLDLGLPDMSGYETCRRLRQETKAPVLVLSVRARERDKVAALDAGADDYLTKPFGMEELLARVRAHLRRWRDTPAEEGTLRVGDLCIDFEAHTVTRAGEEIRLTRTEYEILRFLARNAGRVITHSMILQHVWGPAYEEDVQSLRVHIANLRRKIEPDPARPCFLQTEIGVGYRFVLAP